MRKKTPETIVKDQIKSYLKFMGWFQFPVLQGMGAYKGITDLVATKNGHTLWIEVKAPKGRQSDHQKLFEHNIKAAGGHYVLAKGYEDVSQYITERGLS